MTQQLQNIIETAWDQRAELSTTQAPADVREAVAHVIAELDAGRLRVAERQGVGQWQVNQWVKKAVLLSFRLNDNRVMRAGELAFFDKVDTNPALVGDEEHRSGVKAACRREGTTTTYEWAIPLYTTFPETRFEARAGRTIGFDVAVVDADICPASSWSASLARVAAEVSGASARRLTRIWRC